MLVSVKVIHLLLILVLFKGKLSNECSLKGLNMVSGGCSAASNGDVAKNVILVDDSQSQSSLRTLKLRGRKMAFDGNTRLEKMRGIGQYEETWVASSRARVKEQWQISLDVVKGQQSKRSLLLEKEELAGFGAFTADYKGPTHHPPRHN